MKTLPLWGLLSFFIVIRLLLIFTGLDTLYAEHETLTGTMSKMLLNGVSPWLLFKCFYNNHFGVVLCSIVIAPLFHFFGETLVALRLAVLFFALGTPIVLYLFLNKFFDSKVAVLATLLYILSPPNYVKSSSVMVGGYAENNFFSILAFFIFYRIFFAKEKNQRHLYALSGFVCGFALFYDYLFLLTFACCLLLWFVSDRGMLVRKQFYVFLSFFFIGFSPWFYYNMTHHWNAIFILRGQSLLTLFTKNSILDSLFQLKNLVIFDIPLFFGFKDFLGIPGLVIAYLYYFALVIPFLGLMWMQRKSITRFLLRLIPMRRFSVLPGITSTEAPLIIYVIVVELVYAFSGVSRIHEDHIIPFPRMIVALIVPQLLIIASIFAVRLRNHHYGAWVSGMIVFVLVCAGFMGNVNMISPQHYAMQTHLEGYNYFFAGRLLKEVYGENIKQSLHFIKNIDAKQRLLFYEGHKWAIPHIDQNFSVDDYVHTTVEGSIEKNYWPFAYEALGRFTGLSHWYHKGDDESFKRSIPQVFLPDFYRGLGRSCVEKEFSAYKYNTILGVLDEQYRHYFREGMGTVMDSIFAGDFISFHQFMATQDKEAKLDIYRGFAHGNKYPRIDYRKFQLMSGFGQILTSYEKWRKRIDAIDEEFNPYFYQRLGIEVGWRFIFGIKEHLEFLQTIGDQFKPFLYRGIGMGIGWRYDYDISTCVLLIKQAEQQYWPYMYEGLGAGTIKRIGYRLDDNTLERVADKIPQEFRNQFRSGATSQQYGLL